MNFLCAINLKLQIFGCRFNEKNGSKKGSVLQYMPKNAKRLKNSRYILGQDSEVLLIFFLAFSKANESLVHILDAEDRRAIPR